MSFQESPIESDKHQHNAYIRDKPLPESISEEQHINTDDNSYQTQHVNCDQYPRCSHGLIVPHKLAGRHGLEP